MTKGLFCETIALIHEQEANDQAFGKALDLVGDGHFVYGADNKYHKALMNVLSHVFDDIGDCIGWWLYEDVEKIIYEGDEQTERRVDTPELLYDFLVENKAEREAAARLSEGGAPK